MKLSKLLQMLLGFNFLSMSIVGDEGGGAGNEGGNDSGNGDASGNADGNDKKGDDKGDKGSDDGKDSKKGGVSDNEAKLLKEVMDKKNKLDKLSGELAQAKEQLKQFDGIDVNAVKALLKEREDAENKQLEAKGEWDRLKQRMAEEHTKQIETLQGEVGNAKNALAQALAQINELSVGNLFGQSAFIRDKMTLPPAKARALYAAHFEYQDGKVVGFDKPKGAEGRTAFVDSMGNTLGFDDVMAKLVESDPEKDYLLRSTMKGGAGSESNAKPGSKQTQQDKGGQAKDGLSLIAEGLKGFTLS